MWYLNRLWRWRGWTFEIDLLAWSVLPELQLDIGSRCIYVGWLCVDAYWCWDRWTWDMEVRK